MDSASVVKHEAKKVIEHVEGFFKMAISKNRTPIDMTHLEDYAPPAIEVIDEGRNFADEFTRR